MPPQFLRVAGGRLRRARKWIGEYLSHSHNPDPEAEQAYQHLIDMSH